MSLLKSIITVVTELPVYSRIQCGYPVGDLVNILLKSDFDFSKVCSVQLLSVTENSCFVFDIYSINFEDLKTDDLGALLELRNVSFALHSWAFLELLIRNR